MKLFLDMAITRSEALDRCQDLGKQFIIHFDKIYNEPASPARGHWESEMNAWWNKVRDITLKEIRNLYLLVIFMIGFSPLVRTLKIS